MRLTAARAVQVHQVVRQGTTAVTLVALARLGLGTEAVGNFESLRYVSYLLTAFWVNALGTAYLRVRRDAASAERWYVFYLLVALLGGVIVFGLFAYALPALGGLLLDNAALEFGLAFGTFTLGSVAGTAVEQEAIGDGAGARLLAYSVTSNGLQLALLLGPLAAGLPVYLAMWGLAATAVYRLAWVALRFWRKRDTLLPPRAERRTFWSSASRLSLYGLGGIGVLAVDHALVGYRSAQPDTAIALWRYGAQELPLVSGVVAGLGATALAEAGAGMSHTLASLRRRVGRLTWIVLPVAIAITASSAWWFPRLLTPEFAPAHIVFNTMLLIVPTRLLVTTPQLVSLDQEGLMLRVGVLELLVNVGVSLALVGSLGMLGIALGTVVAYAFEKVCYVLMLSRRGVAVASYLPLGLWLALTSLLVAVYVLATDFSLLSALR